MDRRYHINVFWSVEDAAWIADVPDLRFCSAFGPTPEVAVAEVQIAMKAWLDTMADDGLPLPEARYRPAIYGMPFAA